MKLNRIQLSLVQMIQFFRRLFALPLHIYTDGSHKGKWGSWSYVLVCNDKIIGESSGREKKTNSHRMEFQGAIEALKGLPHGTTAVLHTDSRVLINSVTKKTRRPAVNPDQMEVLENLMAKHKISWLWVKAHSGNVLNEHCDRLCISARKNSSSMSK